MIDKNSLRTKMEERNQKLRRRTRRIMRLIGNWYVIIIAFLALYVTLPFVAPTLMAVGATGPGNVLYTIYSPMCHQFAFRSLFLYGEQPFYPREDVGASGKSFDEMAVQSATFRAVYTENRQQELRQDGREDEAENYVFNAAEISRWTSTLELSAREFRGDEKMGYKVALCQRDIAIYSAMVIAGIIFIPLRHRLRPAPLYLYVLLGLAPIAIDGFSQLLGYPPFDLWDPRETTPSFRLLTGALFGVMNVWLAFPYLHRSMRENYEQLQSNLEMLESDMEIFESRFKE